MFTNTYEFAGVPIEISTCYSYFHEKACNYLTKKKPEFFITANVEDTTKNMKKYSAIKIKFTPRHYFEYEYIARKVADLLLKKDVIFVHGSAITYKNKGLIIVAKSGTGKSTHAAYWKEAFGNDVIYINDDKPFVKYADGKCKICSSPWSGKRELESNIEAPLDALCFLQRDDENFIEEIDDDKIKEDKLIMRSFHYEDPQNMIYSLSLIKKISKCSKAYIIHCTDSIESAYKIKEGICKGE